jgi:hypothetical protein
MGCFCRTVCLVCCNWAGLLLYAARCMYLQEPTGSGWFAASQGTVCRRGMHPGDAMRWLRSGWLVQGMLRCDPGSVACGPAGHAACVCGTMRMP